MYNEDHNSRAQPCPGDINTKDSCPVSFMLAKAAKTLYIMDKLGDVGLGTLVRRSLFTFLDRTSYLGFEADMDLAKNVSDEMRSLGKALMGTTTPLPLP